MFTLKYCPWDARSACVSFPSAISPTRTNGCSQNHTGDDKRSMGGKRRENREFPLDRLHFQTRVDRWVLITALCVVEWNAQHNWLVCINIGGVSSRSSKRSSLPSANFAISDPIWILWKLLAWAGGKSRSLFKCYQTRQPRVSRSPFIWGFQPNFSSVFYF